MSGTLMTTPTVRYRERLWVPLWWWPLGMGLTTLLALELNVALYTLPNWVGFAVLLPVAAVVLLWLGRHVVKVTATADGQAELWVDDAHLPTSAIERTAAVPASAKSAALGRQFDPAAFLAHRPWIGPMVLVVLDDPDDPTPYWLVSSRHPDRVVAALTV
ncbi:MAG: DUF3093 domain-containing protein [Mycolicibacterium insubricum]|uniref:DUF3093 domain-containing protein n=1 Tax=Mycolicibacterium insubricum TaxID=444597 RepID=A0A1X0DJN0_9MYCO|nr:DUF3093 domain-containing protein [Mycolicibacterium insubricum]MCB0929323.1 DUF3093 domain-containing protein [Mycobacterium sp.]MCB9439752.1 DUF3093 domain-containing protein [Mycolicibacterium sp.]ORA72613.1 hypothetical protein BST26_05020 [Mycolicibacterium insubricum]